MGQSYITPTGQPGTPSPISSGTGDVILSPTSPKKSKKGLVILIVLAVLVVVAVAALAISRFSSVAEVTTTSFDNFNRFTNYLTYGEDSIEQVPETDMMTLNNKATAMYSSQDIESMQTYFNTANELLSASQNELIALEKQKSIEAQQELEESDGEIVEENYSVTRELLNSNFATVVQFASLPYFTVSDLMILYLDGTDVTQYINSLSKSINSTDETVNQYLQKQQEILASAQQLIQLYVTNDCIQDGAISVQCEVGTVDASAQSILNTIAPTEDEAYQIRQQPIEEVLYASQNIYLDIYSVDTETEEADDVEE